MVPSASVNDAANESTPSRSSVVGDVVEVDARDREVAHGPERGGQRCAHGVGALVPLAVVQRLDRRRRQGVHGVAARSARRRRAWTSRPGSWSTSTPTSGRCRRAPLAASASHRVPEKRCPEQLVGQLGVRHRRLAAQRAALGQAPVGLGVDPAHEERRHRRHRRRVAARPATKRSRPARYASITSAWRSSEKMSVTLTLMPAAIDSSMARRPSSVAGDLDHHVGPVDTREERTCRRDGAIGVVGERGRHLDRHEPVASALRVVHRAQEVGGRDDVGEHHLPVRVLDRQTAPARSPRAARRSRHRHRWPCRGSSGST